MSDFDWKVDVVVTPDEILVREKERGESTTHVEKDQLLRNLMSQKNMVVSYWNMGLDPSPTE
ncbi:hypothetical protein D9611_011923 [Ephemerocybe angulata]|uniref:Uncharacterized protein n=1 Tax=Ephemerocybe angulata TaxID=980116 RepID=A0A8H5FFM8_9AGAR|nr:hypothetical protein D9611_011923 [Tulosesus angulatus]